MGGLQVSIPPQADSVRVDVDGPDTSLGMNLSPDQARQFASLLVQGAEMVERAQALMSDPASGGA